MKRKTIIILVLVVIIVSLGTYGYFEYNRPNKDLLKAKPALLIDPASLISAYEKDPQAFREQFVDKIIAVEGRVKKIDAKENPVVIFLGDENSMSAVQCSMDSSHAKLYRSIKENEKIILKGMVTGGRTQDLFGTDIILSRCVPENGQDLKSLSKQ